MSIIASVAKGLLVLDARIQDKLSGFWYKRADTLLRSAQAVKRQADADLTAQLAALEAQYKKDVARTIRQLNERKDDAVDKAYARRDMDTNDAQDDIAVSDALASTGLVCALKSQQANDAIKALGGGA